MINRYVMMAAFGGSAVWAAASQFGATKPPVEFTRPALPPAAVLELKPVQSLSHVVLPVELGPLTQHAEDALPQQLAVVHEWLADAACGKRNRYVECNSAKIEGDISRAGPVELQVAGSMIKLVIPVKYALTATGAGWASALSEHKAGETKVDVSFAVSVNPVSGLDVTKRDDPALPGATVGLLKGNVKLARLLDQQLRPVVKAAEDDLRRTLATMPVMAAVTRAWDALAQPFELGTGSGLWLKGAPEFYAAGGFVANGSKLSYQVPIASHLAISDAGRSQPSGTKRTPVASLDAMPAGPSRVRIGVPIDLEAMRQAAQAIFVNGQVFESRADRFTEPLKVKVRNTRVYPALRLIGLELDVEVTNPKGATYAGKLNLAGRPVLDTAAGIVTLADLTFPPVSGKETAAQAPGIPRLGTEPFTSMFAAGAKLDVSRALSEALPRASQMLNQRIGDDLMIKAELAHAVPVSLELTKDGALLLVDLVGDLAFVQDGSRSTGSAASTAEAIKVKDDSSQKPAPSPKRHIRHH